MKTTKRLSLGAREQHARRLAASLDLRLTKGVQRFVGAEPGYMLLDISTTTRRGVVFGSGAFDYEATLDEIETYLALDRDAR